MAFHIYTRTGDKGTTALIGGTRVGKDNIRIDAYGTVDELNSCIGFANDLAMDTLINEWVLEIQDRLFTIGASLATDPEKAPKNKMPDLRESDIAFLENRIDEMAAVLPPLQSFVLPGGNSAASAFHIARTVCRRAERIGVAMQHNGIYIDEIVLRYLNRLSDFLFQVSRYVIHITHGTEIPWRPRV